AERSGISAALGPECSTVRRSCGASGRWRSRKRRFLFVICPLSFVLCTTPVVPGSLPSSAAANKGQRTIDKGPNPSWPGADASTTANTRWRCRQGAGVGVDQSAHLGTKRVHEREDDVRMAELLNHARERHRVAAIEVSNECAEVAIELAGRLMV